VTGGAAAYHWIEVTAVDDPGPCYVRGACKHAAVVPVEDLAGQVVAWLCPTCDRQLSRPPDLHALYADRIDALTDEFDWAGPGRRDAIRTEMRHLMDRADAAAQWRETVVHPENPRRDSNPHRPL
jgi:hypothetical protein